MTRTVNIKWFAWSLALGAVAGGAAAWWGYQQILRPNVGGDAPEAIVYIYPGHSLSAFAQELTEGDLLADRLSFERVARWMGYTENLKPGRYAIRKGWNNKQLVGHLRSGNQAAVTVTFNHVRNIEQLAGRVAPVFMFDSIALAQYLLDPEVSHAAGITPELMLTRCIANSYQIYWTSTPEDFWQRMQSEHDRFWAREGRLDKLPRTALTQNEVYILASIVEKETLASRERKTVAGLYINRLRRNMPLQADPTVVFATGQFDLQRVLYRHLEVDSPYNTYLYSGLPPGPIYMPSIESIDAVLDFEEHDYLYMCAPPNDSGLHAFATNLRAHNANAKRYQQWLNARGIR